MSALTELELNRLRWRCRRGLLENDLILARFLQLRGPAIDGQELVALDRLLGMPDNDLWDVLSGRTESNDADLTPLLTELKELRLAGAD